MIETSAPDRPATEPDEAEPDEPRRREWLLGAACVVVLTLIVVDRARLLDAFGFRYTDEDQSLLWFTTEDLRHGHVRAPYFYGQAYGSWLEALLAVPLRMAGVALRNAVPIAAAAMTAAPCLLLAAVAWRRRAHLAALAILTGYLLLTTDAVVGSAFPRGLTPGVFIGSLAVVVAVCFAPRPWAVVVFGCLAVIGASFNETSLLVTGPAAAFLVLQHVRNWRVGLALLVGIEVGVASHLLAKAFYAAHPSYEFHRQWRLVLDADLLAASRGHLHDYFGAYGFDFLRSPAVPLVLLGAAIVAVGVRRGLPGWGAGLAATAAVLLTLSASKATDGSASVFFPYFRFFLALPVLVAYLVVQASGEPRDSRRPWVARAAAAGLVALAVAGFSYRSGHVEEDVVRLAGGTYGAHVRASATAPVLARCEETRRQAGTYGAGLVVYVEDRVSPYLCGAELYGTVETLFPSYERRTWLLEREAGVTRDRMLVADVGQGFCDHVGETTPGVRCEVVSDRPGMVLVTFPPQPTVPLLRRLGLAVRQF